MLKNETIQKLLTRNESDKNVTEKEIASYKLPASLQKFNLSIVKNNIEKREDSKNSLLNPLNGLNSINNDLIFDSTALIMKPYVNNKEKFEQKFKQENYNFNLNNFILTKNFFSAKVNTCRYYK